MKFAADLIGAFETAYVLQKHLGSYRVWNHFLSDCVRGRQDIAGHVLLPRGRLSCLRGFGPAYSVADIKVFIQAVKAAVPDIKPGIRPVTVQLDSARGWKISKFERESGNPVARRQTRALGL